MKLSAPEVSRGRNRYARNAPRPQQVREECLSEYTPWRFFLSGLDISLNCMLGAAIYFV